MPARHRHHHSSERPKTFTMTLECCSRSSGSCVHDALETAFTNSRNMQFGTSDVKRGLKMYQFTRLSVPADVAVRYCLYVAGCRAATAIHAGRTREVRAELIPEVRQNPAAPCRP
jgi:hypothetical protein